MIRSVRDDPLEIVVCFPLQQNHGSASASSMAGLTAGRVLPPRHHGGPSGDTAAAIRSSNIEHKIKTFRASSEPAQGDDDPPLLSSSPLTATPTVLLTTTTASPSLIKANNSTEKAAAAAVGSPTGALTNSGSPSVKEAAPLQQHKEEGGGTLGPVALSLAGTRNTFRGSPVDAAHATLRKGEGELACVVDGTTATALLFHMDCKASVYRVCGRLCYRRPLCVDTSTTTNSNISPSSSSRMLSYEDGVSGKTFNVSDSVNGTVRKKWTVEGGHEGGDRPRSVVSSAVDKICFVIPDVDRCATWRLVALLRCGRFGVYAVRCSGGGSFRRLQPLDASSRASGPSSSTAALSPLHLAAVPSSSLCLACLGAATATPSVSARSVPSVLVVFDAASCAVLYTFPFDNTMTQCPTALSVCKPVPRTAVPSSPSAQQPRGNLNATLMGCVVLLGQPSHRSAHRLLVEFTATTTSADSSTDDAASSPTTSTSSCDEDDHDDDAAMRVEYSKVAAIPLRDLVINAEKSYFSDANVDLSSPILSTSAVGNPKHKLSSNALLANNATPQLITLFEQLRHQPILHMSCVNCMVTTRSSSSSSSSVTFVDANVAFAACSIIVVTWPQAVVLVDPNFVDGANAIAAVRNGRANIPLRHAWIQPMLTNNTEKEERGAAKEATRSTKERLLLMVQHDDGCTSVYVLILDAAQGYNADGGQRSLPLKSIRFVGEIGAQGSLLTFPVLTLTSSPTATQGNNNNNSVSSPLGRARNYYRIAPSSPLDSSSSPSQSSSSPTTWQWSVLSVECGDAAQCLLMPITEAADGTLMLGDPITMKDTSATTTNTAHATSHLPLLAVGEEQHGGGDDSSVPLVHVDLEGSFRQVMATIASSPSPKVVDVVSNSIRILTITDFAEGPAVVGLYADGAIRFGPLGASSRDFSLLKLSGTDVWSPTTSFQVLRKEQGLFLITGHADGGIAVWHHTHCVAHFRAIHVCEVESLVLPMMNSAFLRRHASFLSVAPLGGSLAVHDSVHYHPLRYLEAPWRGALERIWWDTSSDVVLMCSQQRLWNVWYVNTGRLDRVLREHDENAKSMLHACRTTMVDVPICASQPSTVTLCEYASINLVGHSEVVLQTALSPLVSRLHAEVVAHLHTSDADQYKDSVVGNVSITSPTKPKKGSNGEYLSQRSRLALAHCFGIVEQSNATTAAGGGAHRQFGRRATIACLSTAAAPRRHAATADDPSSSSTADISLPSVAALHEIVPCFRALFTALALPLDVQPVATKLDLQFEVHTKSGASTARMFIFLISVLTVLEPVLGSELIQPCIAYLFDHVLECAPKDLSGRLSSAVATPCIATCIPYVLHPIMTVQRAAKQVIEAVVCRLSSTTVLQLLEENVSHAASINNSITIGGGGEGGDAERAPLPAESAFASSTGVPNVSLTSETLRNLSDLAFSRPEDHICFARVVLAVQLVKCRPSHYNKLKKIAKGSNSPLPQSAAALGSQDANSPSSTSSPSAVHLDDDSVNEVLRDVSRSLEALISKWCNEGLLSTQHQEVQQRTTLTSSMDSAAGATSATADSERQPVVLSVFPDAWAELSAWMEKPQELLEKLFRRCVVDYPIEYRFNLGARAIVSIAGSNFYDFINSSAERWFDSIAWRGPLMALWARIIQQYPSETIHLFPTAILHFIWKALDPHSPNRSERDEWIAAASNLFRVAVRFLPNVGFHQGSQRLVVGHDDGQVFVYDVKSTNVVCSFQSHSAPIACVAYSASSTPQEIAVVSTALDEVRFWRLDKSNALMSLLAAGSSISARVVASIPIPMPPAAKEELKKLPKGLITPRMITSKCRLAWLSPSCVELTTPWHERIQLIISHNK